MVVPTAELTRDRIIRATNSQTQLPAGALRATEKIQLDIEEWLARNGYYYERRANYWKNLEFEYYKIVSMVELAKAVLAVGFGEPHLAVAQAEALLDDDRAYSKIFNQNIDLDAYVRVIDISHATDDYLRVVQSDRSLPGGSIEPWRYQYASAVARFLARGKVLAPNVVAQLDVDDITEARARRIFGEVKEAFEAAMLDRLGSSLHEVAAHDRLTSRIFVRIDRAVQRHTIQ